MSFQQMPRPNKLAPPWPVASGPAIDVKQLLRLVLRRIHFVIILGILGIMLGYEAQTLIRPAYTSSVSILLDPRRPGEFGAESEFANLYVDSAKIASVLAIITSAKVLAPVVASEHLDDDPEFATAEPSKLERLLRLISFARSPEPKTPETQTARRALALLNLIHAVKVVREGFTYIVNVSVTAYTPAKAARLAQAVGDAYLDDQVRTKSEATQRDHDWLVARLSEVSADLMHSERAVEEVRRKYGLVETDRGPNATVDTQSVTDLNAQLLKANGELVDRRAAYEQAQLIQKNSGNLDGLPEAAASLTMQELRKQQADVRRQLADYVARYTAVDPERIRVERDLQALDKQIDAELLRIVANLRSDYERALSRRQGLLDQLGRMTSSENSAASVDGRVQLRDAQRAVDANHSLYDALLIKLRDVDEQQTRSDPEARVISPAMESDGPSFPKRIMFLGGGGALGVLLGAGLIFAIPSRARGFADVTDAETRLGLPVLGVLPSLPRNAFRGVRGPTAIPEYVLNSRVSQFAECLRAMRIAVCHGGSGTSKVVQITSARMGEGKSTVAASLALSAALGGLRTALVDLDIRRPSIPEMFGLPSTGHGDAEASTKSTHRGILQTHQGLPLTVIGAGSLTGLHPDIISSQQFGELIKGITRSHELVILDNPPILAVSDPLATARFADATVLVVESVTPKAMVDQAVKVLRAANAPLTGIILNKANLAKAGRYGHGFGIYKQYSRRMRQIEQG